MTHAVIRYLSCMPADERTGHGDYIYQYMHGLG